MDNFIFADFFKSFNQGTIEKETIINESDSRHILWKIQTNKGLFAIKEFKNSANLSHEDVEQINFTEKAANKIKDNELPAVPAYEHNNSYLQLLKGRRFLLYDFIMGDIMKSENIKQFHTSAIAEFLAKLHNLNLKIEGARPAIIPIYNINDFEDLNIDSFFEYCPNIIDLIRNINEHNINDPAKKIISHADLHPGNVMWNNEKLYILDWAESCSVPKSIDLFNSAIIWSGLSIGKIDEKLLDNFIDSYEEHSSERIATFDFSNSYWTCMGWGIPSLKYYLGCLQNSNNNAESDMFRKQIKNQLVSTSCMYANKDLIIDKFNNLKSDKNKN